VKSKNSDKVKVELMLDLNGMPMFFEEIVDKSLKTKPLKKKAKKATKKSKKK